MLERQKAGAGAETAKAPEADLQDRLREVIDALKQNPDPRAGDIDTDAGGRRPPLQHKDPSPSPEKAPSQPNAPKKDPTNLIDDLWGILMLLDKRLGRPFPGLAIPPKEFFDNKRGQKNPA